MSGIIEGYNYDISSYRRSVPASFYSANSYKPKRSKGRYDTTFHETPIVALELIRIKITAVE